MQDPIVKRPTATVTRLLLSTVLLMSCDSDELGGPNQDVHSVVITPSDITLGSLGETIQLTATANDAAGNQVSGKAIAWSSSDASVAHVSPSGNLTGLAEGAAAIRAVVDGVTGEAAAVVEQVAAGLEFIASPRIGEPGGWIHPTVAVQVRDAQSNPILRATDPISVSLGAHAGNGLLSGTTTVAAIAGIARFGDLSVDREGTGYTLVAKLGDIVVVQSAPFDILVLPSLTLMAPIEGDRIEQNNPSIGCPANQNWGYGFEIRFDWADARESASVAGYHIYVRSRSARFPIANTVVFESQYSMRQCGSFVIDRNLPNWDWHVEAVDASGQPLETSRVATFEFAPCRLVDGRSCSAPPQ